MAQYFRVAPRIWSESWDDDTRLLALYILTCPHRITEGLYRLPKGYMTEDLRWPAERLAKPFAKLLAEGFMRYDERAQVVLICKALKWQAPENPNQEKAAMAALEELPPTPLLQDLQRLAERFAERFAQRLAERFGKSPSPSPSPSPIPGAIAPSSPDGDQAGAGPAAASPTGEPNRTPRPQTPPTGAAQNPGASGVAAEVDDPARVVMDHFNDRWVPDPWKRNLDLTKNRRKLIRDRLKRWSVDELCRAIDLMRLSPHHCGSNERGWIAPPEFLFRSDENVERFLAAPSAPARASPNGHASSQRGEGVTDGSKPRFDPALYADG